MLLTDYQRGEIIKVMGRVYRRENNWETLCFDMMTLIENEVYYKENLA